MTSHKAWLFGLIILCCSACEGTYGYQRPEEGCFTAETMIRAPQQDISIAQVTVGQSVYAFHEESGELVTGTVDSIRERMVKEFLEIELSNGTRLSVTAEHPLYKLPEHQWRAVGDLNVGDSLAVFGQGFKLETVQIIASARIQRDQPIAVYNFKVREYMNSFANGVLAHFYE